MKKTLCILALLLVFLTAVAAAVRPDEADTVSAPGIAPVSLWEPVYGTRTYRLVLEKDPLRLRLDAEWDGEEKPEGVWVLYQYTKEEVRYYTVK